MPYRVTPLVTGEVYHVFNRSIARQPIFLTSKDFQRALDLTNYYNHLNPPIRFSHFNRLPILLKNKVWENLIKENQKLVDILAFCLMPNHIHFLIKEIKDNGITTFMRKFQNSYAKYINAKTERTGSLFQSMFKAVRILTDEQLVHVARYIHLNPITSYMVKNIEQLKVYPWSSFPLYLDKNYSGLINTEEILNSFKSRVELIKFTEDQISYQRELAKIKHLLFE